MKKMFGKHCVFYCVFLAAVIIITGCSADIADGKDRSSAGTADIKLTDTVWIRTHEYPLSMTGGKEITERLVYIFTSDKDVTRIREGNIIQPITSTGIYFVEGNRVTIKIWYQPASELFFTFTFTVSEDKMTAYPFYSEELSEVYFRHSSEYIIPIPKCDWCGKELANNEKCDEICILALFDAHMAELAERKEYLPFLIETGESCDCSRRRELNWYWPWESEEARFEAWHAEGRYAGVKYYDSEEAYHAALLDGTFYEYTFGDFGIWYSKYCPLIWSSFQEGEWIPAFFTKTKPWGFYIWNGQYVISKDYGFNYLKHQRYDDELKEWVIYIHPENCRYEPTSEDPFGFDD